MLKRWLRRLALLALDLSLRALYGLLQPSGGSGTDSAPDFPPIQQPPLERQRTSEGSRLISRCPTCATFGPWGKRGKRSGRGSSGAVASKTPSTSNTGHQND